MLEKIYLIDDIRMLALKIMEEKPELNYDAASQEAKIKILGSDVDFLRYSKKNTKIEEEQKEVTYKTIADRELSPEIKTEVYSEAQLKEMVIANRMGVDLKPFINIFYTPAQIKFITIAATAGVDITPYTTNLQFDPEQELKRLEGGNADGEKEDAKVLVLEG